MIEVLGGIAASSVIRYLTSSKFVTYPVRRQPPWYHLVFALFYSSMAIFLCYDAAWWPKTIFGNAPVSTLFQSDEIKHGWLINFRASELVIETILMVYLGLTASKWQYDMLFHHSMFLSYIFLNPYDAVCIYSMAAAELSIIPLLLTRIFTAYGSTKYQNIFLVFTIPLFTFYRIICLFETSVYYLFNRQFSVLFYNLCLWLCQLFWMSKLLQMISKNYALMSSGKKDINKRPSAIELLVKSTLAPKDFKLILLEQVSKLVGQQILGEQNLFECGIDSIKFIQLRSFIKNEFGLMLDPELLATYDTVDGLAQWYNSRRNSKSSVALMLDSGEPSLGQERLFVLLCKQVTDAYNVPFLIKFNKSLIFGQLSNSIKDAVRHHKMLHAVFKPDGSYSLKSKKLEIPIYHLNNDAAMLHCATYSEHAFDVLQGPLFLFHIIQVEQETWIFGNIHHLVCDGWSIGVLLQDIGSRYANKPLKVLGNYEDYVKYDKSIDKEDGMAFWKKYLLDMKPFTLSQQLSTTALGIGQRHTQYLDNANKLAQFGGSQRTTIFNCFVSMLVGLFGVYTNEDDIVFGTVFSNRMRQEDMRTVGYFVRTLPFRQQFNGEQTFIELLQQVKKTSVNLMVYQDYLPEPEQMANLKILLVIQNNELDVKDFNSKATFHTLPTKHVQFDLIIQIFKINDKFQVIWDYNTSKYNSSFIKQIAKHFQAYYDAVLINSNFKLLDSPILSQKEKQLQLVQWNESCLLVKPTLTAAELFVKIASQYPDKVALVHNGQRLTFHELNRKSNALANSIINTQCGTGGLIGLHTERSTDVIIGILGIWKSGNGYLPLDPTLPVERLTTISKTAELKAIVYNKQVTWFTNGSLIKIDNKSEMDNIPILGKLSDCAYCLFTSGSTGVPKGVMISQFNLLSFFQGFHQNIKFDHTDVWAMNHTFIFDLSVGEITLSLLSGCKLVIVDKDILLDDVRYWQLTTAEELSMIWIPINVFLAMTRTRTPYAPSRYIRYFFAGEKIDIAKIPQWVFDAGMQIIVGYGPTETTIICSYNYVLGPSDTPNNLGAPFPDTQMYILNKHLDVCPIGVVGEVYIGGSLCGMGYLQQQDLTNSKFIKNPFHKGVMYQSGDLAKYLQNGQFQFAERTDFQVKLRGFRIELGEVESCLDKQPMVERSVVIVIKQDKEEDSFIAAYVILKKDQIMDRMVLFDACRNTLPYYMIPSTYTALATFPVTPTGKFNRKGLPVPSDNDKVGKSGTLPSTRMEVLVANRMELVLNLPQNSMLDNDDFFLKGGNSLKAMKLLNTLNTELKQNIPLKDIFEYTTVSKLAQQLGKLLGISLNTSLANTVAILNSNIKLSSCQQRLYLHQSINPDSATYNVPLLFATNFSPDIIKQKLLQIGSKHEILRTVFTTNDADGACQHIQKEFILQMIESRSKQDFQLQSQTPFDLSKLPLFKVFYIKISGDKYEYLFLAHHIIIDEWSWDVILNEIYKPQESVPISQYKDFVLYEANRLTNIDESLKFWNRNLLDSVNPKLDECFADQVQIAVGKVISQSIKIEQLGFITKSLQISPFVFFMGTYGLFLMKALDEKDLLITTPISLRDNIAFENSLGFFVNTIPFRFHVVDELVTLQVYYQRVKQDILNAMQHAFVPYEQITKQAIPYCFVGQESLDMSNVETKVIHNNTCKFNISLVIDYKMTGDIDIHMEYNSNKYSAIFANELLFSFTKLLENVASLQFSRTLRVLSLKGTGISCTPYGSLPLIPAVTSDAVIDKMARKYPTKIAIQSQGVNDNLETISYESLSNTSDHYAQEIHKQCEQQSFVGIYMERRIEMLISILAIWKANCIYVPLDPKLPDDRIKFIIQQANISLVLSTDTNPFNKSNLKIDKNVKFDKTASKLDIVKEPGSSAYCLFTSGSTGVPKGVLVTHANLVSYITSLSLMQQIKHSDVGSMMHTFTFDVSLQESMIPLMNGCTLHLFRDEDIFNPEGLWPIIEKQKISHFSVPISVFYKMAKLESPINHLLRIQLGGENLDKHKIPYWFKQNKHLQIWFMYGPTECTVACSTLLITDYEDQRHLIGRPLPGYYVWILDKNQQVLPVGMYGELHISGCGVGKGYLDATKTKERFYSTTIYNNKHEVYNSGDIARITHDGYIQFLGRKDFQVKVRGFRIELSEIQSVIQRIQTVDDALCVVREDKLEPYIAAYVIGNCPHEDILKLCQQCLPYYMVPSALVTMTEYPLQINGKINLKALPAPKDQDFLVNHVVIKPRNEQEENILKQFATVLQKEQEKISVIDNFFTIGGTSTLAAKLSLLLKVKISVIFKHQNVREIANYLNNVIKVVAFDIDKESEIIDTAILDIKPIKELNAESVVLLTGASGFVGLFLMAEIANICKVVCPMRDLKKSIDKIKQQQSKYQYLKKINYENVEFVDLKNVYNYSVDFVIHNAAQVNFVDTYEAMKPFNVGFTRDLLHHFYKTTQPKFLYISTLSCLTVESYKDCPNAYVLSKFVSERVCLKYKALQYPISLCRIGQITGDSQFGEYFANDLISCILKSVKLSKLVPDIHYDLEWTPVDLIAKEIVLQINNDFPILSMIPPIVFNVQDLLQIVPNSKLINWIKWKNANQSNLGVYFTVLGDDFHSKKHPQLVVYKWKTEFKMNLELIKCYLAN